MLHLLPSLLVLQHCCFLVLLPGKNLVSSLMASIVSIKQQVVTWISSFLLLGKKEKFIILTSQISCLKLGVFHSRSILKYGRLHYIYIHKLSNPVSVLQVDHQKEKKKRGERDQNLVELFFVTNSFQGIFHRQLLLEAMPFLLL